MKKGLLVKRSEDNKSLELSLVEIDEDASELHQIYNHLGVELIDVVNYKNKSIYVDDEGLLKPDPQLTMFLNDTNQDLYGNLLIMGDVDDEGETLGISSSDADSVLSEFEVVKDMLTEQEYLLW